MANNMENRRKIARALAKGVSASDIANSLSVSEAYISALRKDVNFADLVESYSSGENKTQHEARVGQWDRIFDQLADTLESNIAKINSLDKINTFINTVSKVRKELGDANRQVGPSGGQNPGGVHVTLMLPQFLKNDMKEIQAVTNENNEIVEVDGTQLITASTKMVLNQLKDFEEDRTQAIKSSAIKKLENALDKELPGVEDF